MNQFIEWFNYSFIKTVTHRHLLVNTLFIYYVCVYVCMHVQYVYVCSFLHHCLIFKANSNYFQTGFPKHFFLLCASSILTRSSNWDEFFWLHTSLSCQSQHSIMRSLLKLKRRLMWDSWGLFLRRNSWEAEETLSAVCDVWFLLRWEHSSSWVRILSWASASSR